MTRLKNSIPYKNLVRRPARTAALTILAALLSFSVFCGTMVVGSLKNGLSSLQDRLGADIMVVPYEAVTKSNLSNIILQGSTGYFYMDSEKYERLREIDGVGQISPQFFLASTSSGCCSLPVQIIGIDPETDFTISPWIKKSGVDTLSDMEVYVGNDLNAFVGDKLTFYGTDVRVVGKLDKTGTTLDTAVYTNQETIEKLIASSLARNMNEFADIDPEEVVSCVLINVADGYTVEDVLNDINIHVRKVEAIQTKNMISGVSESLSGISDVIGILMIAVWVLALSILVIAFAVSVNERKKEFAVIRAIGASGKKLSGLLLAEGLLTSLFGGIIGAGIGCLVVLPFGNLIETQLAMPFLLPAPWTVLLTAVLSVVLATLAGGLTSMLIGRRVSRIDTALILREG